MAVKSLSIISIAWFCLCFINTMILEPVYNCIFGVYANYAMDVSSVVARSLFCIIFILWSIVGSVFVWKELSVPQKKAEESQSLRTTQVKTPPPATQEEICPKCGGSGRVYMCAEDGDGIKCHMCHGSGKLLLT